MFSCEYCESFKNTYFEEHLWTAASEMNSKTFFFRTKFEYSTNEVSKSGVVIYKEKCHYLLNSKREIIHLNSSSAKEIKCTLNTEQSLTDVLQTRCS